MISTRRRRSLTAAAASLALLGLVAACSGSAYQRRAEEAVARRDWAAAVESYRLALRDDPGNGSLQTGLARAEYHLRSETQDQTRQAMESGRYADAVDYLAPLLRLFPEDADTREWLWDLTQERLGLHRPGHDYDSAARALGPMLHFFPSDHGARQSMLEVVLTHVDYDLGRSDFDGAWRAADAGYDAIGRSERLDDALASVALAESRNLEGRGRLDDAVAPVSRGLQRLPLRSELQARLFDVTDRRIRSDQDRGDLAGAVDAAREARRALPGSRDLIDQLVETTLTYSQARREAEDYATARRAVLDGLAEVEGEARLESELVALSLEAAQHHREARDYASARNALLAALTMVEGNPQLTAGLVETIRQHARRLMRDDRHDEAYDVALQGLRDVPGDADMEAVLVEVALERADVQGRDYTAARGALSEALDQLPGEPRLVDALVDKTSREARRLRRADDFAAARTAVLAALAYAPDHPELGALLVDVTVEAVEAHLEDHDHAAASAALTPALARFPEDDRLVDAFLDIGEDAIEQRLADADYRGALEAFEPMGARLPAHPRVAESATAIRDTGIEAVRAMFLTSPPEQVQAEANFLALHFPGDRGVASLQQDAVLNHANWRISRAQEAEREGHVGQALLYWVGANALHPSDEAGREVRRLRASVEESARFRYHLELQDLLSGYPEPEAPPGLVERTARRADADYRFTAKLGPLALDESYQSQWAAQRYLAGYRRVRNPEYERCQSEVHRLERDLAARERDVWTAEGDLDQAAQRREAHRDAADAHYYERAYRDAVERLGAAQSELERTRRELEQARTRILGVSPTVEEEAWEELRYEVRDYTRELTAPFELQLQTQGQATTLLRRTYREATRDRTHQGFPTAGLPADPLDYPVGDAAMAHGFATDALAAIEQALAQQQQAHRERFREEGLRLRRSHPDQAVESLVRYLVSDPSHADPEVTRWLGEVAVCASPSCV